MTLQPYLAFLACTAAAVCLASASPAQTGQIVAGPNLGSTFVSAAGDVDDDGNGDYIVYSTTGWEVRSGATGQPFPALARPACTLSNCVYGALQADLDADGHDDLVFYDRVANAVDAVSGRDGSVLLRFANPNLRGFSGGVDHDGDGFDDLMVSVTATNAIDFSVLSGRNASVIASYSIPVSATQGGGVGWCGDLDGDSYIDLARTTTSLLFPYTVISSGVYGAHLYTNAGQYVTAIRGDTDGDGRDELRVSGALIHAAMGQVVWQNAPEPFQVADVDGDGAHDIVDPTQAWSGRTHAAWPGVSLNYAGNLGDIDGDGRDELVVQGVLHELAGAPPASRVRTRGSAGLTSNQSHPRIRHRARARVGDTLRVHLQGAGGANFAVLALGTSLQLDLTALGAPGNYAYVQPLATAGYLADSVGHARHDLAVPNDPALVGLPLSMQWVVLDRPANALGAVTSNALDVVVGN